MPDQETSTFEGHPSVAAPSCFLSWFLLWALFAISSKTGHGELDVDEAIFGLLFFVTYPVVLIWLLIGSFLHLKNYRFNPLAPASSRTRTYIWCDAAMLYLLGLAAFIALEGFGLKRLFWGES